MRGWELCPFCGNDQYPTQVEVYGQQVPLGDAEIRMPHSRGGCYAAPTLIAHYVVAHHYRPSAEFIEAVLADQRAAGAAWC